MQNIVTPEIIDKLTRTFGVRRTGAGVGVGAEGDKTPISVSDHAPIIGSVALDNHQIEIISWNMLSDTHLENNFFDLTGLKSYKKFIDKYIKGEVGEASSVTQEYLKSNYYKSKLSVLFQELATYAEKHQGFREGITEFTFTSEMLKDFSNSDFFIPNNLTSEDKAKRKLDRQVMLDFIQEIPSISRGEFVANDFHALTEHALRTFYAIEYGGLKWQERKQQITPQAYKRMHETLDHAGFICFQECTSPSDMLDEINKSGRTEYQMLTLKAKDKVDNQDHCVIIYNPNIYELEERSNYKLGDGKKPAIVARFKKLDDGNPIVVGSLHHPGSKPGDPQENQVPDILLQAHKMQKEVDIPVVIAGDFNNRADFFYDSLSGTGYTIKSTHNSGTTIAPEYGNKYKAVDCVLSNRPIYNVNVAVEFMHPPKISISSMININIDYTNGTNRYRKLSGAKKDRAMSI